MTRNSPPSSRKSSPLLVLTWIDPRPRLAWCGLCLLLILACIEVALRGYTGWALASLPVPCLLMRWARPAAATRQCLELHDSGLFWRSAPGADWLALVPLPGTLLLPALVVLQWRPPGARFVRHLWLWRSDVHESGFRHLRRWLLGTPCAPSPGYLSRPGR